MKLPKGVYERNEATKMDLSRIRKEYWASLSSEQKTQRSQNAIIAMTKAKEGYKHSEETLIKMRKPRSEEGRRNISEGKKGKPWSAKRRRESQANLQKWILAGQNIKISKPQRELYYLLKQTFHDAKMEYLVRTKNGVRFADIAVPSLKLDFEFDGDYWHQDKESDHQRDLEMAEIGWITFRVNYNLLERLSKHGLEEILKVSHYMETP